MNSRKPSPISIPRSLRDAFHLLVHESGVTIERQAEEIGVRPGYLYNTANRHLEDEGFNPQLRWLIPLTRLTKNFLVLDFIEWALGRVAVFLPCVKGTVPPMTAKTLPGYVCRLMKEIGDVVKESGERCADRKLSADDKAQIKKEVRDVIQRAVQIEVALDDAGDAPDSEMAA